MKIWTNPTVFKESITINLGFIYIYIYMCVYVFMTGRRRGFLGEELV